MSVGWGVGMIRMGVAEAVALYLSGTLGGSRDYVETPDSAANSITGDIDVLVRVAAADWTPTNGQVLLAKNTTGGADFAWQFDLSTAGNLRLITSPDGTGIGPATSTATVGFADGTDHWVRVTRRLSDGRVQFFTSSDGSSWTQLGTDTIGFGGGVGIFDSAAPVTIGAQASGGSPLAGIVYYAELRDGIGGSVANSFDTADVTKIGTRNPASVAAGGPWTINGAAWDWVAA